MKNQNKPKSDVWKYYETSSDKTASCKFCKNVTFKNNATRMAIHLSKCKRCPPSIGNMFMVKTSSKKSLLRTEEGRERYKQLKKSAVFHDDSDDDNIVNDKQDVNLAHYEKKTNFPTFVDHMSKEEQESCEKALAKAVFVSGCALSIFEHPLWKKALFKLRPAFKIPNRHRIESVLLDREYTEVQSKVEEKVESCERLTIQLDGWSNIRNEGITNIMVGTPTPLLIESVESEEQSQDHKYYVDCASKVIDKYGPKKFVGIVTDNGGPMKKFRSKLQEKFDWLIEYPCAMHSFQLLISSVMKLPTCAAFKALAQSLIKTIKRSHILSATFSRIRREKKIKTGLQLGGKTRFGSYATSFESLLKSKVALQSLAIDPVVEKVLSSEHRKILIDNEGFWTNIELILGLIDPIKKWITILESDKPKAHLVVEAFDEIKYTLNEKLTDSPLTNDEIYQLEERFKDLYNECVKGAHLAANFLHPSTEGKKLTTGQIETAMEFLEFYAEKLGIPNVEDVSLQAIQFNTHIGPWEKKYIWNCSKKIDAITWWTKVGPETKLKQIALNILSLPATSAPTERTFKTQGRIHSKARNRLLTVRAAKLTFIAFNSTTLMRKPVNEDYDVLKKDEQNVDLEVVNINLIHEAEDDNNDSFSDTNPEIDSDSDVELSDSDSESEFQM